MSYRDAQTSAQKGRPAAAITPLLVQKVADRVYALWIKEMTVERERARRRARRAPSLHPGER